MNNELLISIIIPAHNSEKYIERCVTSALDSTYKNIEVIVVDDGSKDNTVPICRNIKDARLKVIENAWGGVSVARNTGIMAAKGIYISFIDSDDRIAEEEVELLLKNAEKYQSDITFCNYYAETENGVHVGSDIGKEVLIFDREGIKQYLRMFMLKNYAPYEPYFQIGQPWGTLYKASLLKNNNIRFIEGMQIKEDVIFNFYASQNADKIVRINTPLYYYNIANTNSLSSKGAKNIALQACEKDIEERIGFYEKYKKDDELFRIGLYQYIMRTFLNIIIPVCAGKNEYNICTEYLNKKYMSEAFKYGNTMCMTIKEKIAVWMIRHHGLKLIYNLKKTTRK